MKLHGLLPVCLAMAGLASAHPGRAAIQVLVERHDNEQADAAFKFKTIPSPARKDAASAANWTVLDGEVDPNAGGLDVLHDGKLPSEEDEPRASFFFKPQTDGGRIRLDLGRVVEIKQVNTFSWHPGTRGPQVYRLFGADGKAEHFISDPKRPADPEKAGWQAIASVDTRPKNGSPGGQYGVSILDPAGNIGAYRYLLFDISQTEDQDPFGNTFYSEIDVVDQNGPAEAALADSAAAALEQIETVETAPYEIRIVTTDAPDLTSWTHERVAPMVKEWYPKLSALLASDGFEPPRTVTVIFDKRMRGVAATGGARIRCAATWFKQNLEGEALGAVFHELVHVVQQYGRARRAEGAARPPGWLVEGIADYVRWFKFEPQSHGAEITARNLSRARYDGNYRITANFLNWATETYDQELVPRLNAAIRQGKYTQELWQERTGHSLEDLGAEWRAAVEKKVNGSTPPVTAPEPQNSAGPTSK